MRTENWQAKAIQLLAVPGLLVSFYLLLFHNGSLVASCGGGGWDDCGIVSGPDGKFSSIGPIPVALIGLVGYAVIFLSVWLADFWETLDAYLPELLIGLTGFALLLTLGLTALEIFVIHAICRYCVISAIFIVIMFVLAISYVRSVSGDEA